MNGFRMDAKTRKLIKTHGVSRTAKILKRRYATVRDAAVAAGIVVKRGRRVSERIQARNKKIRAVRKKTKKFLHQIGKRFRIGRERVRQILNETGGDPLR